MWANIAKIAMRVIPVAAEKFAGYANDNPGKASVWTLLVGMGAAYASYKGFDVTAISDTVCGLAEQAKAFKLAP